MRCVWEAKVDDGGSAVWVVGGFKECDAGWQMEGLWERGGRVRSVAFQKIETMKEQRIGTFKDRQGRMKA